MGAAMVIGDCNSICFFVVSVPHYISGDGRRETENYPKELIGCKGKDNCYDSEKGASEEG
jgi:hypothetical protein